MATHALQEFLVAPIVSSRSLYFVIFHNSYQYEKLLNIILYCDVHQNQLLEWKSVLLKFVYLLKNLAGFFR